MIIAFAAILLTALFLIRMSAARLSINAAGGSGWSGIVAGLSWLVIVALIYLSVMALVSGRRARQVSYNNLEQWEGRLK